MSSEGGAMAVAMSVFAAIAAVLVVAVAALGTLYAARAQAGNAADAAALAAAVATYPAAAPVDARDAARAVARVNGAALLECVCPTDSSLRSRTVTVTTAVRADVPIFGEVTVRVSSRAEFDPIRWLGAGRGPRKPQVVGPVYGSHRLEKGGSVRLETFSRRTDPYPGRTT